MATVAQIKAAAEQFRQDHGTKFRNRQETYFAIHNINWQGIISHAVIPDDGIAAPPDLTRRPTDQVERWQDVFTGANALPANWPIAIQVDVYDGPSGKGWTITVLATKNLITYSRTWNFGPETYREDGLWRNT